MDMDKDLDAGVVTDKTWTIFMFHVHVHYHVHVRILPCLFISNTIFRTWTTLTDNLREHKRVKSQSWARAFFGFLLLRFRTPGGVLSRSFLGLKFRALAFALPRFRAPCFLHSYFRALRFSRSYFALFISFRGTGFLSRSRFPFVHVCIYIYTHTHIPTSPHTYTRPHIHTYIPTYMHTYIHTYIHRGGRWRFFRAFALASAKPKKERKSAKKKKREKKRKRRAQKKKSANSRFFLSPTIEIRFQSPKKRTGKVGQARQLEKNSQNGT
jgi:hypothetical protein